MNKRFNIIKYVSMFITLFLVFQGTVFASQTNVTPDQVLDDIAKNYEVVTYRQVTTEEAELSIRPVLEFNSKLLEDCCEDNGNLVIDGKEYNFSAKYVDSNGKDVYLANNNLFYEYSLGKIQYINGEIPADSDIIFSLTPKDGSNAGVTVNAGKINVQKDANGNVDPKVKTIASEYKVSGWDVAWSLIKGNIKRVGKLITQALTFIAVPAGDSFLYMISSSVGEPVTIDTVVYNQVNKLSIDFFEDVSRR